MNLQYFKHNYTYITHNREINNLSPQAYHETDLMNLFILCFLKDFVVVEHDGNLNDPKTWNVLMQIPSKISLAQQSIVLNILKNKNYFQSFKVSACPGDYYYEHFSKNCDGSYYKPSYPNFPELDLSLQNIIFSSGIIATMNNQVVIDIENCDLLASLKMLCNSSFSSVEEGIYYIWENGGCIFSRDDGKANNRICLLPDETDYYSRMILSYFISHKMLGYIGYQNMNYELSKFPKFLEDINLSTERDMTRAIRKNNLL